MKSTSLIFRLALTAMFLMVVVVMIEAKAVDDAGNPLEATTENQLQAEKAVRVRCTWCAWSFCFGCN